MELRKRGMTSLGMTYQLGTFYAKVAGRGGAARFNRAIMQLGGRGLGMLNYRDMKLSGERAYLRRAIGNIPAPTVFDVGANKGAWIDAIYDIRSDVDIHAFEPNAGNADILRRRFPNAHIVESAVSSSNSPVKFYDYDDQGGSGHATVIPGVIEQIHGGISSAIVVPATTIDLYSEHANVTQIDLLKIDVEGYEYEVLAGAASSLETRVRAIQFEFNEMNLIAKRSMKDFSELLGPRFRLNRLLPNGDLLDLESEILWLREQFVFQNIVATRY